LRPDLGRDGTTDVAATYSYDASGQRTRSVVTSAGVTTTKTYVWDGISLARMQSTTAGQTTTIAYLYDEQGTPSALSVTVPGTAKPYVLPVYADGHGNVVKICDGGGGAIARYSYDPYGRPLACTFSATPDVPLAVAQAISDLQPLRYAGYVWDAESGLYYCSQRYYDPATCQFISRDPAGADAQESSYQYCGGDPVNRVDPTGTSSEDMVWLSHLQHNAYLGAQRLAAAVAREYARQRRLRARAAAQTKANRAKSSPPTGGTPVAPQGVGWPFGVGNSVGSDTSLLAWGGEWYNPFAMRTGSCSRSPIVSLAGNPRASFQLVCRQTTNTQTLESGWSAGYNYSGPVLGARVSNGWDAGPSGITSRASYTGPVDRSGISNGWSASTTQDLFSVRVRYATTSEYHGVTTGTYTEYEFNRFKPAVGVAVIAIGLYVSQYDPSMSEAILRTVLD
jgi:RHS repeat-associated protein